MDVLSQDRNGLDARLRDRTKANGLDKTLEGNLTLDDSSTVGRRQDIETAGYFSSDVDVDLAGRWDVASVDANIGEEFDTQEVVYQVHHVVDSVFHCVDNLVDNIVYVLEGPASLGLGGGRPIELVDGGLHGVTAGGSALDALGDLGIGVAESRDVLDVRAGVYFIAGAVEGEQGGGVGNGGAAGDGEGAAGFVGRGEGFLVGVEFFPHGPEAVDVGVMEHAVGRVSKRQPYRAH